MRRGGLTLDDFGGQRERRPGRLVPGQLKVIFLGPAGKGGPLEQEWVRWWDLRFDALAIKLF
jgi:hypothetical protein